MAEWLHCCKTGLTFDDIATESSWNNAFKNNFSIFTTLILHMYTD